MPENPIAVAGGNLIPQGAQSIKNITSATLFVATPTVIKTTPGTMLGFSVITVAAALAAAAITSISWTASVATVTTTAAHNIPVGDTITITIAGVTPAGYNGTFLATSTGASTFTYPLASNPGTETVPGTWVMVPSAGSVNDCTTAGAVAAGNQVIVIPNTVGITVLNIPCDNGITVVPPVANSASAVLAVWYDR
jgi:hypothetical protein